MNRHHRSALLLACALIIASACDETGIQDVSVPLPEGTALIKFFNFSVDAPGVNFYANDTKMTAILSATGAESTSGVNYGGAGASGLYLTIPAGSYTLSGRIAADTDKNLPISSLPVTLAAGKAYSFYQSGIYDKTAKTAEAFIVEDSFTDKFDYTVAYVRFVNAVPGSAPLVLYAKDAERPELTIGAAVAYKSAGAFVSVPPGVYSLRARDETATTDAVTRTSVSFVGGRVYTITARGSMTGTRFLDNTTNR